MRGPKLPPSEIKEYESGIFGHGETYWRVHPNRFAPNSFNPCEGPPTRFAPLYTAAGECIPTIYFGQTKESALFEGVCRDLPPMPMPRRLLETKLRGAMITSFKLKRVLTLAPLYNQHLAALGLTRQTMIECHGEAAYLNTAKWAAVFHDSFPDLDGIVWMSRQQECDRAFLLFGDRVAETDLEPEETFPLDSGPERILFSDFCRRYKIDIIPLK